METLDIQLSKINFHKVSRFSQAGIPYLIGQTTSGQTIKGDMAKPILREHYRLWGDWRAQKGGYPDAFEFVSYEPIVQQGEGGVITYLKTYVDGLGVAKATAIVKHFGADTLTILCTEPERAAEVPGITPTIIASIKSHFEETTFDPMAYARLVEMFAKYKIPKRIITTLAKDFGSSAPEMIREKPYLLLAFPRLGWKLVDAFARETCGYPADGLDRHKAAIVEALERLANDGHTWGARVDIERIVFQLISMRPVAASWGAAASDDLIKELEIDGQTAYALPKLAQAEETIAQRLATLAATGLPLPFSLPTEGLNEGQAAALHLAEENPVVIICGAPGVGKTYCVTRTLTGLIQHGMESIVYVAPTGKAAKRAAELLQKVLPNCPIRPTTVHKALAPTPSSEPAGVPRSSAKLGRGRDEFTFSKGPDNPIEADIVVVDEGSMLDVKLGASLLNAIPNGTRLIIVGDPNQLPSVGAGSFLRDAIASGVPTATLTEIQRNSGRIVKACHSILKGEVPQPSAKLDIDGGENWAHIELNEPAAIAKRIVELHDSARKKGKFDPTWDMQVISPEKEKPGIGCHSLNRFLGDLLNPYREYDPNTVKEDDLGKEPEFKRGDKVIRLKNGMADQMIKISSSDDDYSFNCDDDGTQIHWDGDKFGLIETDIVNGDMGTVMDIYEQSNKWYVIVQFKSPDRLCRLPYGDCNLTLAYAVTCHKAQGSGFPYVVVPMHNSFYAGLFTREMVYTLISRSETLLVTVGQFDAFARAIGRKTVNQRKTRLKGLLAPHFAPQEAAAPAVGD